MVIPLLILSLLILVASALLEKPEPGRPAKPHLGWILPVVVGAGMCLWAQTGPGAPKGALDSGLGVLLGVLVALPLAFGRGDRVACVATAAVAMAATAFFPTPAKIPALMGVAFGLSLAATCLRGRTSAGLAIAAGVGASANILAMKAQSGPDAFPIGTAFLALGALSLLAGSLLPAASEARSARWVKIAVVCLPVALVGEFILWAQVGSIPFTGLPTAGVALALLTTYLLRDDSTDAFPLLLSGLIWLGAATVAFSLAKGLGVAVVGLAAVAVVVGLGESTALVCIAPILALAYYRAFRELNPSATQALDLGQHYTMIGFAAGALAPLVPAEWLRDREGQAGQVLWSLILVLATLAGMVLLGAKGAIGLVAGLGFAGILAAYRNKPVVEALAFGGVVSFTVLVTYGWLGDWLDLGRTERTQALVGVAVVIGLLSWLLQATAGKPSSASPKEVESNA